MRVIIDGAKGKSHYTFTYDLLDSYDKKTGTTSMARTTGYTCAAVARLLLSGAFTRKGICPPEYIGQSEACYRSVLEQLSLRDIVLEEKLAKDTI